MTSITRPLYALVALLACGAPAWAYQPGEVFRLDLEAALLSPQPIGPAVPFEPVPVQAKGELAQAETAPAAKAARAAKAPAAARAPRVTASPRPAAKNLARRRNPLDANASDTRMQVWPCRSGGICTWRK
jgi:hypothetical protein